MKDVIEIISYSSKSLVITPETHCKRLFNNNGTSSSISIGQLRVDLRLHAQLPAPIHSPFHHSRHPVPANEFLLEARPQRRPILSHCHYPGPRSHCSPVLRSPYRQLRDIRCKNTQSRLVNWQAAIDLLTYHID